LKKLLLAIALALVSCKAQAVQVIAPTLNLKITTDKVSTIEGVIDDRMAIEFMMHQVETAPLPGDRVVIIRSPGGYVSSGMAILRSMSMEHALGTRMICLVDEAAASMAFNILSFCDVRLATDGSRLLAHKIALASVDAMNHRITAKYLRRLARELEQGDALFCTTNAAAMHMSRTEYDRFADKEYEWTAEELLQRGYLNGLAIFFK
jgi:ATP-dependent protease ClpP protease subunit